MRIFLTLLLVSLFSGLFGQIPDPFLTPFEQSDGFQSARYEEATDFFERLRQAYPREVSISRYPTDVGKSMQLILLSGDGIFDRMEWRRRSRPLVFINNAIHPGESCGVDASMMLARDLLRDPELRPLLNRVVVAIVPMFNVGGALNRSCCSRANQIGPMEQGFRGNGRNLDLNRDFIKLDAVNTQSLVGILQTWEPDFFVDTHTTNGADYAATLTYLLSQTDKLSEPLGSFLHQEYLPAVRSRVERSGYLTAPYVNMTGQTPEQGIAAFMDYPRYSVGYAALLQIPGITTEAHMLKPFAERVYATYSWLKATLEYFSEDPAPLLRAREESMRRMSTRKEYPLQWSLDLNRVDSVRFRGYAARYLTSPVTGKQRLYYDRSQPYERNIPYNAHYRPTRTVKRPVAYIIPQAWREAIDRLEKNGVVLRRLARDTTLAVEAGFVENLTSISQPWEGHFYHREFDIEWRETPVQLFAGDVIVYTASVDPVNSLQTRLPYVMHVLEPYSDDSFFRWNFFDGAMMRKEYFSPYLFEDEAVRMLAEDPLLRAEFEAKRATDTAFANDAYAQLMYLYEQSTYAEPSYMRYPVYRWRRGALPVD